MTQMVLKAIKLQDQRIGSAEFVHTAMGKCTIAIVRHEAKVYSILLHGRVSYPRIDFETASKTINDLHMHALETILGNFVEIH